MSTTLLRYIPEDPAHVPGPEAVAAARAMLTAAAGKPAQARVTEDVTFVDQGESFERLGCPACGQPLDMQWWQERMSTAGEASFADLGVTVPCCGADTSLHDLDYELPAGFARFVLEVQDPGDAEDRVDVEGLERVVGCLLRRIVARY